MDKHSFDLCAWCYEKHNGIACYWEDRIFCRPQCRDSYREFEASMKKMAERDKAKDKNKDLKKRVS